MLICEKFKEMQILTNDLMQFKKILLLYTPVQDLV